MKLKQRILSLGIAFSMMLTGIPQVGAVDGSLATPQMTLSVGQVNQAQGAEKVAVTISYTATEAVDLCSTQFDIVFDSQYLELDMDAGSVSNVSAPIVLEGNVVWWSPTLTSTIDGQFILTAATASYYVPVTENATVTLGTLYFNVISNAPSGETEIKFADDTVYSNKISAMVENTPTEIANVDFTSTATINIVEAGVNLSASSVVVDGTEAKTVTATVYDSELNKITSDIDWSVTYTGGGTELNNVLTVDNGDVTVTDGTITVDAKAAAGDYIVEATYGDNSTESTATLTVTRTASVAKSISVSSTADSTDMTVPADGSTATQDFTATVLDQFGDAMTVGDTSTLTWAVYTSDRSDGSAAATIDGITITNGVVSVTNAAKSTITTGTSFVVGVSYGEFTGYSEAFTIARAASTQTSFSVAGVDTLAVPVKNETTTATYTAPAIDQYGETMTGTYAPVTWSIEEAPTGVSVDGNTVSVASTATATSFTLKATSTTDSSVTATKTISITKADSVASSIEIGSSSTTDMEIPTSGTTSRQLQATVYDQYGVAMTDATKAIEWSITPDTVEGVYIFNEEALVVQPAAKDAITDTTGKEFTLTASYTDDNKTITASEEFTVKRADPVLTSVEIASTTDNINSIYVPVANDDGTSGSASKTYNATAYDQYGTVYSGATFDWTYVDTDGTGVTGALNSEDNTYTITVNSDDVAGTVTLSATSGGVEGKKEITINKVAAAATTVSINETPSEMTIPADNATTTPETQTFTATVKDQYNATYTGDVEWTILNAVDGVSIDEDGTISVTNAAKAAILDSTGTEFTVKATCGDASDSELVTIKRAVSEATSVAIYKGGVAIDSDDTIVIPTSGSTEVTYTTATLDQYGAVMSSATETWTFTNGTGVSFDSGTVTVSTGADTGEYTLTSTNDPNPSLTASITIKVVDIEFTGADDAVSIKTSPTYGDTWGDIITFNNSGLAATVGDGTIAGTFSLDYVNYEGDTQYPDAGDYSYQIYFTSSDDDTTYNKVAVLDTAGSITVAQRVAILEWDENTYAYDGELHVPTATVSNKPFDTDEVNVTTSVTGNGSAVGEYTATADSLSGSHASNYKLSDTATANQHTFNIVKSGTDFDSTGDDGTSDVTYNDTYTYGATITVTATPTATGEVASVASVLELATNQMALFYGETQISDAVSAGGDGKYTMTYNTTNRDLEIGENTVTVQYVGNDNMADYSEDITITLEAKAITPSITGITAETYTGSAIEPTLTVTESTGTYTLTASDYDVEYDDNINAGEAEVTVTMKGYFTGSATAKFDIDQAEHADETTTGSAKYGNDGSVSLTAWADLTGAELSITSGSDNAIFDGTPEIKDDKLVFTLENDVYNVSKTADVVIKVKSTNYEDFNLTVTITVSDKDTPDLDAETYVKTYDGDAVDVDDLDLTATFGGDDVDGDWEFVDENGVKLTDDIVNVADSNTYTLEFTPDNTDDYISETITVAITISKKEVTVTADDQSMDVDDQVPDLTVSYDGWVGSDDEDALAIEAVAATDTDGSDDGSFAIYFSTDAVLDTDNGANYYLTHETGTLTVEDDSRKVASRVTSSSSSSAVADDDDDDEEEVEDEDEAEIEDETEEKLSSFIDVQVDAWYSDAVETMLENGWMNGVGDGKFAPDDTLTRAMMAQVVHNIFDNVSATVDNGFSDVSGDMWYADAIAWCVENDILQGMGSGDFQPDGELTTQQMLVVLYRLAGMMDLDLTVQGDAADFSDAPADWAADSVAWAIGAGLMDDMGDVDVLFNGTASRSMVAQLCTKFTELMDD